MSFSIYNSDAMFVSSANLQQENSVWVKMPGEYETVEEATHYLWTLTPTEDNGIHFVIQNNDGSHKGDVQYYNRTVREFGDVFTPMETSVERFPWGGLWYLNISTEGYDSVPYSFNQFPGVPGYEPGSGYLRGRNIINNLICGNFINLKQYALDHAGEDRVYYLWSHQRDAEVLFYRGDPVQLDTLQALRASRTPGVKA